MSGIPTADLRGALLKKGFRVDQTHHEMFWFWLGDKKTSIRTRLSHGEREYGDPLLAQVTKQMRLSRRDLDRFVECNLSADAYRESLITGGHVTPAPVVAPPATPARSDRSGRAGAGKSRKRAGRGRA